MLRKRQRGGHFFAITAGMDEAHLGLFMRFAAHLTAMGGAVPDIDAENAGVLGRHWNAWRPAKEAALALGLLARVKAADGTDYLTLGGDVAAAFSWKINGPVSAAAESAATLSWKINDHGAAPPAVKHTRLGISETAVEIVEKPSAKRARAASEKKSPQETSSLPNQPTESLSSSSSSSEKPESCIGGREECSASGPDGDNEAKDLAAWIRQATGMQAALEPGDESTAKALIAEFGQACIRGAVAAFMRRKKRAIPGRVIYFTQVVRDFAKAASQPPPRTLPLMVKVEGGAVARSDAQDAAALWRITLRTYTRPTGVRPFWAGPGPEPGDPWCQAPPAILREFGLAAAAEAIEARWRERRAARALGGQEL